MAREAPVQFRPGPLAAALAARGDNQNETAQRDLERYYGILARELKRANLRLVANEALLLCDALNGSWMDANSAPLLWAEVADAIAHDGLDRKWDVDGAGLVDKLRALNPAAALAVIDAVERAWHHGDDLSVAVIAVGLAA